MSDALTNSEITIEIVDARENVVRREKLVVPRGSTVAIALALSALPRAQELLAASEKVDQVADSYVGIWGRRALLSKQLTNDDRIELYRELIADPKQTRLRRASDQGYRWQGRTRRAASEK